MLAMAHGEAEAMNILGTVSQNLLGQRSEILVYRPDPSYVPRQYASHPP